MMLFMFVTGVWGLVTYLRGGTLAGNLAGTFVIGQVLIVVQIAAGTILFLDGSRSGSVVHYLYGLTALLVLPFAWSYLRERSPRQALLIYSLIALFLGGVAIRAMTTAG